MRAGGNPELVLVLLYSLGSLLSGCGRFLWVYYGYLLNLKIRSRFFSLGTGHYSDTVFSRVSITFSVSYFPQTPLDVAVHVEQLLAQLALRKGRGA